LDDLPETEKSGYISARQEQLAKMLNALEEEQQALYLAAGPTSRHRRASSGSGGLKTKSKSEQSFENVDYEDVTHTPGSTPPKLATEGRRTTSGNWIPAGVSGWFGGAGSKSGAGDPGEPDRDDVSSRVSRGWSAARDITEEMTRGTSSGIDPGRG
jgi:hypothetical protein